MTKLECLNLQMAKFRNSKHYACSVPKTLSIFLILCWVSEMKSEGRINLRKLGLSSDVLRLKGKSRHSCVSCPQTATISC
jgi:hypothetical protein